MIKVKFESKSNYVEYCKASMIGNFPRKYGSSYVFIDNGKNCEPIYLEKYDGYLDVEPLSYPCIMCYYVDYDANIFGNFIYPNDFNE